MITTLVMILRWTVGYNDTLLILPIKTASFFQISAQYFPHSITSHNTILPSIIIHVGVPLAKSDPFSELTGENNIAPLDPNGGHSTLQMTYHYHAIPTIFFDCETGWDSTNLVWATSAPDGNHSPLIGYVDTSSRDTPSRNTLSHNGPSHKIKTHSRP